MMVMLITWKQMEITLKSTNLYLRTKWCKIVSHNVNYAKMHIQTVFKLCVLIMLGHCSPTTDTMKWSTKVSKCTNVLLVLLTSMFKCQMFGKKSWGGTSRVIHHITIIHRIASHNSIIMNINHGSLWDNASVTW